MEAGGKDCEEDTLQTAFKKLRVDAESLSAVVNVSEALGPRVIPRVCVETSGAKPKHTCPKDNWHGCMRKASRGATRTQRRRRSKSPILHPPKFTYCNSSSTTASSLSPPSGHLKHQRLAEPEVAESCAGGGGGGGGGRAPSTLAVPAQKELLSPRASGHMSPPVFGASAGYEPSIRAGPRGVAVVASSSSCQEIPAITTTNTVKPRQVRGPGQAQSDEVTNPEKGACDGAECGAAVPGGVSDFQALSKLHISSTGEGGLCPCSCGPRESPEPGEGQGEGQGRDAGSQCQCQSGCRSGVPGWKGVEVYSFTGLRHVISECERNLPGGEDAGRTGLSPPGPRTLNSANSTATTTAAATSPSSLSPSSSGSPRSCSEQARAYVDDITIEDLSGYMEYYLYIPKKMSHMAEMMYT